MLTLFAIPKAFKGQFNHIQLNAIESWTRLRPRPEIILFGDDAGTAEVAARYGLRHVPEVDRNEHGTPRVDALFAAADKAAAGDLLCYINSDIILTAEFAGAVERLAAAEQGKPFLGVGRKTSLPIQSLLDFDDPGWEGKLREWARAEGRHVTYDSDFFLFRRGHFPRVPRFAIGRCYWSSWFMWDTRRRGMDMIDMTGAVLTVEPRHDYSHARSTGGHARLSGVEYEANRRLFRGCRYYTTVNSNLVLEPGGVAPAPADYPRRSLRVRLEYWVYFLLKGRLYPYSLPLIVAGRGAAGVGRALRGLGARLPTRAT